MQIRHSATGRTSGLNSPTCQPVQIVLKSAFLCVTVAGLLAVLASFHQLAVCASRPDLFTQSPEETHDIQEKERAKYAVLYHGIWPNP